MAVVSICSDFEAPQNKVCHCFPIYLPWIDGEPDAMILVFWMLSFKPAFPLSSFTFLKRLFNSLFSAIRAVSSAYLRLLIFLPASWFQLVLHPAQRFSWCTQHRSSTSRVTIYSLDVLLFLFGTSCCSMSSSNCCFLTFIQISQEADHVVWYSQLLKNFPQFVVMWLTHKVCTESDFVGSKLSFLLLYLEGDWWLETNSHTFSKARVDGVLMSLHLVNINKI